MVKILTVVKYYFWYCFYGQFGWTWRSAAAVINFIRFRIYVPLFLFDGYWWHFKFKRLAYVTEHLCARRFEKPPCGAFPVSRSVGFFEQWKISVPPIDNMERESTDVVGVAVTSIGLSDVVIPCSLFIHPSSGHEKSSLRYPTSSSSSSCSPVSSAVPTITWSSASCVWADFLLAVTGVNLAFGTLAPFCMLSTGTV